MLHLTQELARSGTAPRSARKGASAPNGEPQRCDGSSSGRPSAHDAPGLHQRRRVPEARRAGGDGARREGGGQVI